MQPNFVKETRARTCEQSFSMASVGSSRLRRLRQNNEAHGLPGTALLIALDVMCYVKPDSNV